MKHVAAVQNSKGKIKSRKMVTREILKSVDKYNGNIEVNTLPSESAQHEVNTIAILARSMRPVLNINWKMFDKAKRIQIARQNLEMGLIDHGGNSFEKYSKMNIDFISGNIFKHAPSIDCPSVTWFDICSGPTENNINSLINSFPAIPGSKFFVTFMIDGIREKWPVDLSKKSNAEDIHKYLFDKLNPALDETNLHLVNIQGFPYKYSHVTSDKINRARRVAVFGFEVKRKKSANGEKQNAENEQKTIDNSNSLDILALHMKKNNVTQKNNTLEIQKEAVKVARKFGITTNADLVNVFAPLANPAKLSGVKRAITVAATR